MSSSPSSENTVMIENPLGFITKAYFLKVIQGLKFITEKDLPMLTFNILFHQQLPSKVYISFPSKDQAEQFISTFNGKSFEASLN